MAGRKKVVAKAVVAAESVKNVDLKTEYDAVASAQLDVQEKLSQVSAVVAERVARINELDAAIAAKEAELKALHDLGDSLVERDEVQAQIAELEEDLVNKKVRAEKERKQTEEDYVADFARRKRNLEAELTDKREQHAKEVAARNAELTEREKLLKDLQSQVDSIPKLVSDAEKKIEAIVSARLTKEFEHAKKVVELENVNQLSLLRSQLDSANAKVADLTANVASLREELVNTRREANEVIKATVDAAAGRQALDALKDVQRQDSVVSKR